MGISPADIETLRKYGTRSLRRLLQPGIDLAGKGFVVDKTLQQQTESNAARFADFPATAAIYLPGGQPIAAGPHSLETC